MTCIFSTSQKEKFKSRKGKTPKINLQKAKQMLKTECDCLIAKQISPMPMLIPVTLASVGYLPLNAGLWECQDL